MLDSKLSQKEQPDFSIILPTFNESKNIVDLLKSIQDVIAKHMKYEILVIDDNSPDGTGKIVKNYSKSIKNNTTIKVVNRIKKLGLGTAILEGINHSRSENIVVMDADMSHPCNIIPKLVESIKKYQYDIAVASRYIHGGKIENWSLKRKLISKIATIIAKKGLGIDTKDPMSGFFAFKKKILQDISVDAIGYKFLLEVLVKTKNVSIKEIPYTFQDRQMGSSKLDTSIILNYCKSVWKLYRYGRTLRKTEKRISVRFLSKAARFFTVGASGLGVNYLASLLFASGFEMWYLHATILGIIFSISSNFVLNKYWTFEDRDFSLKRTTIQYGKFVGFSSIGALTQLGMVYYLVDGSNLSYPLSLVLAVGTAAFSNFILNKKWTFKEKVWS